MSVDLSHSAVDSIGPLAEITAQGFSILPGVFTRSEVQALASALTAAIDADEQADEAIRSRAGVVYAARNVLEWFPPAAQVWRRPLLIDVLCATLGKQFGLVRALYFDKPPDRTWSLPWHKDLTIAVRDNSLPSQRFCKPTHKAGVSHVEAPLELLQAMLTLRIHLDDVTEANGPLRVIPGSHQSKQAEASEATARSILVGAGDVLAMRPLLVHSSPNSHAESRAHRRILHLEFAGWPELPDGYAWRQFLPGMRDADARDCSQRSDSSGSS